LSRARDGVPQQAWFPWLCAERMNALGEGVARTERPAEEGVGRPAVISPAGGWEEGSLPLDLLSLLLFFKRCRRGKQGKNGRGTHQGHTTRSRGAPICMFWDGFDNILITIAGVAKTGFSCRKGPMQ
jgi:hypothetical protein